MTVCTSDAILILRIALVTSKCEVQRANIRQAISLLQSNASA